jgi:retron-type reverse transcriptase
MSVFDVQNKHIEKKGVPQGSLMGPTILNLFMNDIFYDLKYGQLFNYADDNSVFLKAKSLDSIKNQIQLSAKEILEWCSSNKMEANPGKF